MATEVKRRRGTTLEHTTTNGGFTGAEGELTVDTTKDTVVVHDGSTVGGFPLLREDFSNVTTLKVDTTYSETGNEVQGEMFWNSDEETVTLVTNGVNFDLGQTVEIHVNSAYDPDDPTPIVINKGEVVYAFGTLGNSGRITVKKMIADGTIAAKRVLGIAAENIQPEGEGKVIKFGKLRKINTNSYNEGDILWVSTSSAGAFQTTEPSAGDISLPLAYVVTKSATVGEIFVRVTPIDENAYQAYDADLSAIAGLSNADGNFIVGNGSAWVVESGSTARTSLGLGNVENTALSTYTGQGGSLDNQYITNGAGYITGYTETDTLADVTGRGASTTDTVTLDKSNASTGYALIVSGSAQESIRFLHTGTTIESTGTFNIDAGASDTENINLNAGHIYLNNNADVDGNLGVTGNVTGSNLAISNWNTAYNWGDHSLAGYLTSYTETDPVFSASEAASITSTDTTNWDAAYTYSQVGHLPLTGGTVTGDVTIKSTDAGAGADPNVTFFRDSASPADNDVLGDLLFSGRNDAATQVTYGRIASQIADASSTTHDGKLRFQVASNAALVTPLTIEGTASTFTTSLTATSFVKTANSGGFLKADGTEDTNTYLTSETSHADVLVDGDFTANGLMKRTGAGTYTTITDSSTNWDAAYTYSQVGHLPLTGGTISSNLIISGNLTVSGTTTTVNTETIKLADNIIMLNSNFEGETPSESSGIEIERGPSNTNKQFLWNETNDRWQTDDALYVSGALTATGNVTGSNLNISNWDTAYGWGDHSTEGYLTSFDITSQTDPKYLRSDANDTFTGTYLSLNSNGFLRTDNSGYFTAQAGTSGFQFRNNANNATRVAILDGGNVGIGETNPLSKVHIEDTSGATLTLGNSQSPNDVVSGTVFGRMNFYASDRSSPTSNVTGGVARIEAISTAAYSTTSPSALLFYTHDNTANDGTVLGNPTERMRINSSGNVGIGVTSPEQKLHVNSGTANFVARFESTDDKASILLEDDDTLNYIHSQNGYLSLGGDSGLDVGNLNIHTTNGNVGIGSTNATNTLVLRRASSGQTEHGLRLEYVEDAAPTTTTSSVLVGDYGLKFKNHNSGRNFLFETGTVLIGKSVDGLATVGTSLFSNGTAYHTVNGGIVQYLNRTTSDGSILEFRKDNSTVGAIGSDSGRIFVNSSGNNLFLQVGGSTKMAIDTNGKVYPATHNTNDLGFSTSLAWRDLYLSGDANIGTDLDVGGTATISQNVNGAYRALLLNNERTAIDVLYHTEMNFQFAGIDGARIRASMSEDYTETANQSSDLLFYTRYNGTLSERLRINDDGNVGIGTTSPAHKLDVNGELRVGTATPQTAANIHVRRNGTNIEFGHNNTTSGYYGTLGAHGNNGQPYIALSADCDTSLNTFTTRGFKGNVITTDGGGSLIFKQVTNANATGQTPTERMRIDSSGNVGIGTSSPAEKLHVEGSVLIDAANLGAETGIFFREGFSQSNKYNLSILAYDHNGNFPDGLSINAYDGISFNTGSNNRNERMRIALNGNVGIGTTSPSNLFHVSSSNNTTPVRFEIGENANYYFQANSTSGYATTFNMDDTGLDIGHNSGSRSLNLQTNSTDRITILGGGNVGIGTGSPSSKLEVSGGDSFRTLQLTGATPALYLKDTGSTTQWHIANNDGLLYLLRDTDNDGSYNSISAYWKANGDYVHNVGNVGIGTSNPSARLDVVGDAEFADTVTISDNVAGTFEALVLNNSRNAQDEIGNAAKLSFQHNSVNAGEIRSVTTEDFSTSANRSADLTFHTVYNGTLSERVRINDNGNVGINTTSPSTKLEVDSGSTQTVSIFKASSTSTTANNGGALIGIRNTNNTNGNMEGLFFQNSNGVGTSGIIGYNVNHSTNEGLMTFGVRNSSGTFGEKMRIDSSGNVGIGTTSPATELDVNGDIIADGMTLDGSAGSRLTLGRGSGQSSIKASGADGNANYLALDSSGGGGALLLNHYVNENVWIATGGGKVGIGTTGPAAKLHVNDTTYPTLRLSTATSYSNIYHDGTTGSIVYSADDGGAIASSSHQFYIDGGEKMRILSGGGITFNGDTAAANALDDYEEGSWTPAFSPQDDIIDSVTYDSIRFGRYTKIGDTVHVWGRIRTDVLTFVDYIGALNITGLPFTPATILSSGTSTFAGTIGYATAWGGDDPWFITAESGVDKIELWYKTSFSGNLLAVQTSDAGSGANSNDLIFQLTYKV